MPLRPGSTYLAAWDSFITQHFSDTIARFGEQLCGGEEGNGTKKVRENEVERKRGKERVEEADGRRLELSKKVIERDGRGRIEAL